MTRELLADVETLPDWKAALMLKSLRRLARMAVASGAGVCEADAAFIEAFAALVAEREARRA